MVILTDLVRNDERPHSAEDSDVALELLDDVVHLAAHLLSGEYALLSLLELRLELINLSLRQWTWEIGMLIAT